MSNVEGWAKRQNAAGNTAGKPCSHLQQHKQPAAIPLPCSAAGRAQPQHGGERTLPLASPSSTEVASGVVTVLGLSTGTKERSKQCRRGQILPTSSRTPLVSSSPERPRHPLLAPYRSSSRFPPGMQPTHTKLCRKVSSSFPSQTTS